MAITQARPEAAVDAAHGIGPRRHPIAVWLTTTDHKKIGIMYLVNSYFWFGVAECRCSSGPSWPSRAPVLR